MFLALFISKAVMRVDLDSFDKHSKIEMFEFLSFIITSSTKFYPDISFILERKALIAIFEMW